MTRMFNSRRTQDFVTICTRITGDFKDKSDAEFLKKRTVKEHMIEQDITTLGKLLRPNLTKASIYADIKSINAVHFMSLCVVAGKYRHEPSYIVMEMSVDGHPEDAINKLVDAIGPNLLTVFRHLKGVKNIRHMRDRLLGDRVILTRSFWPEFYSGHYRNGLPFSGTAGIDLTDVEDDEAIAVFASKQIQNLNQTVRHSDGDTDNKSANSPLDVFTYVKKAIAQNETDFDLNRAWQRALSRKSTPVFAEKSDSVWRSVWSTPRLIMTVIPRKIWMMIGLLYLTLVALMSIILFGEPIPEGVSAWDKSGFTGQGYARVRPNEKGIYEFLLTPGFIVHGMILALIIALIFSRYIRSVKKPAGALTFVTVMAAFFTFPNIFNPHLFSKQKIIDLWNAAQNMLGNLQAGAQVELTIHPFLDKLLQDMTASQIAIGTVMALAVGIPSILLVKRYVLLPLFRRFHRSLYFLTAIGSFVWLFVLGKQFFRQALLSPDDKTKVVDKITILNKWSETPQNEFTAQLPELIFVPLLLGGLMSLSFYCIVQHAPIDLKRRLSFTPSDHTDGPFEKFKNLLLTLLSPKAAYSAVFFLTAFCVTAMGFFTQGQLYELRAARMENLIFLIIIPLLTAFGMLLVYFKSFKTVDTKDKYNYQTHYWIFFVIAFALLNWKMLNNPRSLEIAASFVLAIIPTVMAVALILGFAFRTFRRSMERNGERTDNVFTDTGKAIFDSENEFAVQNHMLSVQRLIPENFRRRITLPLMLHGIISVLGGQRFRPGFLANVGTVHYARWFHLPNTNNYVFAANYDGSFESYLEDFIAKAALGTNLAWGNCEGFPQMKGLFEGGCEDGDRFKRYARRSMQPTRCWYSAYPEKSAEQIRRNAIIRDGLTKPTISPSDAQAWLDMFGSIPRPESVLEAEKIQGLLYGANGHLAYGACYTLSLSNPDKKEDAAAIKAAFSAWIDSVRGRLDYGNQKPEHEAHYLAISAAGLRKLGLSHALDEDKYTSDGAVTPLNAEPGTVFAQPFSAGMHDKSRRHVLGDFGDNASSKWEWSDRDVLAVVLMYADNTANISIQAEAFMPPEGGLLTFKKRKEFETWNDSNPGSGNGSVPSPNTDPFGFTDGVSQPYIKGMSQASRRPNSIHVTEPGEFILGYKDNRGYFAPSPVVEARYDLGGNLPSTSANIPQRYPHFDTPQPDDFRDLGANGSYLVIRELQQDVAGFDAAVQKAAKSLLSKNIRSASELFDAIDQHVSTDRFQGGEQSPLSAELSTDFQAATPAERIRIIDRFSQARLHKSPAYTQLIRTLRELDIQADDQGLLEQTHLLKTLMVGRHSNGRSLLKCPVSTQVNIGQPVTLSDTYDSAATRDPEKMETLLDENEFLFGRDDPQGHKCPFGSHVRRANPRDGLRPGDPDGLAVANRHRILRRGRHYKDKGENGQWREGTFFMCLNADIDRQFEFLQQTWLSSPKFQGLRNEVDPIVGQGINPALIGKGQRPGFSIQTKNGDIQIEDFQSFVSMKGGGYFFLPGRDAIAFFANL